ncbi:MAG: hypothetical protein ACOX44_09520 [Limnochordia bacterium]
MYRKHLSNALRRTQPFRARRRSGIITLVLGSLLICTMLTSAQAGFFSPAMDSSLDLPADKVFPQGRIFPYGGYAGNAARDKENHFTLHGPVYGDANYTLIPNAEAADMYAIYSVGLPMNSLEADGKPALDLSAEQIAAEIKRQMNAVVDNDTLAWWYVQPEELRSWKPKEMEYLEVVTQTIRENDPQKRPIWMYDPGHRTYVNMSLTAPYLDIVGKGRYTNYAGQLGHRVWNRWTIEQQLKALELSGRPGAIQIAVPEMFQEPAPVDVAKIPKWVRHDVYLALICGAQGIVPFSLGNRSGFSKESWNTYYNAYVQTATELNGELQLGQVFLFGERRNDLELTMISGESVVSPKPQTNVIDTIIEYPSVSLANIAYGTERFIFVANSSEKPVDVRIDGFPTDLFYTRNTFTGEPLPAINAAMELSLSGLGVVGLHLAQGYVNISSPQKGQVVNQPQIPIQIEVPGISLSSIRVTVDDKLIYEGTTLPALNLRTAGFTPGTHHLAVIVTDTMERSYTDHCDFDIMHFKIANPELSWGTTLKGLVPFTFELGTDAAEMQDASVRLISIVNSERARVQELYTGKHLPSLLEVATDQLAEGAYELEVVTTTTEHISASYTERIIIDNWETLEDPLLPPLQQSWFGSSDQLKVVDRSEGWEFTQTQPKLFFGDINRMRRQSPTSEYLTWKLPELQKYEITLYSRGVNLDKQLTVSVSSDGVNWHVVPSIVQVAEQVTNDWLKLTVEGTLPVNISADYISLACSGTVYSNVELGHVLLTGRK